MPAYPSVLEPLGHFSGLLCSFVLLDPEPKFPKGTIVVADNASIFAEQAGDYLGYVRNSGGYRSRYVQVGDDGVELSVRV